MAPQKVETFFTSEAAFWEEVYDTHDVFSAIIQRRHAMALKWVDQLSMAPRTPVLELGCGAGLLSVALAQRGLRVQAVDSVAAMVAQAKRRAVDAGVGQNLSASVGDAHALDFDDASFEVVTALGMVPWLHSPARAISEMSRVLKPGGWLILSADNRSRLFTLLDPVRIPALDPIKRSVKRALFGAHAVNGLRPRADRLKDVDRMLAEAGLDKVAGATCGFGPLTLLWRRILPDRLEVGLERRVQAMADRGIPVIRSLGWHYLVLAQKKGAVDGQRLA